MTDIASTAKKLITDFGVKVVVNALDGSFKFNTIGFYSEKKSSANPTGNGLEIITERTLYVPANNKVPDVNDVVTFGKVQARIMSIRELSYKGKNVVFICVVS